MDACDGCAADCCRRFEVVIHGWDAFRIGRELRLPLEKFVDVQSAGAPDENHQFILDAAAPERRYHRLALQKRAGACTFLVDAGGIGRCGIYANRPLACRAYPALSEGPILQLVRREYCPPGAWDDIDARRYGGYFRDGVRQRAIHDVVSDGWNERVLIRKESRDARALLQFLVDVYGDLEKRAPDWFAGAREPGEDELRATIADALAALGWL